MQVFLSSSNLCFISKTTRIKYRNKKEISSYVGNLLSMFNIVQAVRVTRTDKRRIDVNHTIVSQRQLVKTSPSNKDISTHVCNTQLTQYREYFVNNTNCRLLRTNKPKFHLKNKKGRNILEGSGSFPNKQTRTRAASSTFYINDDVNTHLQEQYPILSEACLANAYTRPRKKWASRTALGSVNVFRRQYFSPELFYFGNYQ